MEIKIKTKFNVGDTALRFNPSTNKLEEFVVNNITVQVYSEGTYIGYHTKDSYTYTKEADLFASKEEFIAQL